MTKKQFYNCPVCGASFLGIFNLSHTRIVRCTSKTCGLYFSETQPTESELQSIYNAIYYLENDNTTTKAEKPNSNLYKFRQHFDVLDRMVSCKGKRILDYGCGVGNFMDVAKDGGAASLMGVEANERARDIAQKKGFIVERNIEMFDNNFFDIVYLNDVLEHLSDPVESLKNIKNALVPNGKVFIATINMRGLKAYIQKENWEMIQDPTHFYYFDARSLCAVLQAAGFRQINELNFFVEFTHHNVFRQLLQRILIRLKLDSGLKMIATK